MNKPLIFSALLVGFSLTAHAQSPADTTKVGKLGEVVVNGARTLRTPGGFSRYPAPQQREHAANGLDLLTQLRLPGVKIDPLEKSITSTMGTGSVVVLLNGVETTLDDVQALPTALVARVDYRTQVPPKYGSHVAVLLDVRTRLWEHGYAFGLNAMNALSTSYNDDGLWGKFFRKNATFDARYNFKLNDVTQAFSESTHQYHYADGRTLERTKVGNYEGGDFRSDEAVLHYNLSIPERRIVDVKGGWGSERFPQRTLHERVAHQEKSDLFTLTHSDEQRMHLSGYYEESIAEHNRLTLSVAAAHLRSDYARGFRSAVGENTYDVQGRKSSWRGELEWQHDFSNGQSLNVGFQQAGAFTRNAYLGTQTATLRFHDATSYAYVQGSGAWKRLYYAVGVGASRDAFGESSAQQHTFYTFRPNLFLEYSLSDAWKASLNYERVPTLPTLAELSAYAHQEDEHLYSLGSVGLHGFNTDISTLSFNYQRASTTATAFVLHEYAHRRIADREVTERDGDFWLMRDNAFHTHHLEVGCYVGQDLWHGAVNVYVEPKYSWDHAQAIAEIPPGNAGISQLPASRSHGWWSVQAGLSAYLGRWSVKAYYRSATRRQLGHVLTQQYATSDVRVGYQWRSFSLSLGLRNAFSSGRRTEMQRLSAVLPTTEVVGNRGFRNMLYVSLSWHLFKGRQNKAQNLQTPQSNWDNGIVK